MKKYIMALIAFSVMIFLFWVSGMEFQRGIGQSFALFLSIYVAGSAFAIGFLAEKA